MLNLRNIVFYEEFLNVQTVHGIQLNISKQHNGRFIFFAVIMSWIVEQKNVYAKLLGELFTNNQIQRPKLFNN